MPVYCREGTGGGGQVTVKRFLEGYWHVRSQYILQLKATKGQFSGHLVL